VTLTIIHDNGKEEKVKVTLSARPSAEDMAQPNK